MTTFAETDVEQAALDWLAGQGRRVARGPDIASATPASGVKMLHSKRTTHGSCA